MGLCTGAEREFACPTNGPTSTGTIMAKIDLRSRGRFENVLNAANEWASVVCEKVQVVQSIRELACPANDPTSTGTIMAKIDLRSRGRFRNIWTLPMGLCSRAEREFEPRPHRN